MVSYINKYMGKEGGDGGQPFRGGGSDALQAKNDPHNRRLKNWKNSEKTRKMDEKLRILE